MLHGVWSAQQTLYTRDEKRFGWSCGAGELLVGQTVDTQQVALTCERDGVGSLPSGHCPRMCGYSISNVSEGTTLSFSLPCHELCALPATARPAPTPSFASRSVRRALLTPLASLVTL